MDVEDLLNHSQLSFPNMEQNYDCSHGRCSSGPCRCHKPFPSLLVCVFANKKSAAIITFVSLNVMYIFSMAVFKISSLLLILSHLLMM